MYSYLFPIFNFNTVGRQSQRNNPGFLLIESYCALVLGLFVFLTFVGTFISWSMYSRHMRSRLRACLYAQAYIERLISENSVQFTPYVYSFLHENYRLFIIFSRDKDVRKFVHVYVYSDMLKNEANDGNYTGNYTFHTGYIYEKKS